MQSNKAKKPNQDGFEKTRYALEYLTKNEVSVFTVDEFLQYFFRANGKSLTRMTGHNYLCKAQKAGLLARVSQGTYLIK